MPKSPPKILVVGIGDDGLDAIGPSIRERILNAQVLLGSERALNLTPDDCGAERVTLSGDLEEIAEQLSAVGDRRAVLLIFGDPMFYGLARYVTEKLGKDRFEVVPHVSSMQLAFARVMESWDEAYLTNLDNHPLESVIERLRTAQKAGLFTSASASPTRVAEALLSKGIDYFHAYVCENLGSRDERVTRGSLQEIAGQQFAPLNVMILVREADAPDRPRDAVGRRLFGNPDEAFVHSQPKRALATSAEVRALALAALDIAPASIVWDIGAGSGSVSVEAAQIAHDGAAYAVEMDAEDHGLIRENADRFGVGNLVAVLGKAPEALADLPDPDAVFIAGGGREVARISQAALDRLRPGGRLVVSMLTINNVSELYEAINARTHNCRVLMVNIAEGADQLGRLTFESLKPSFLVSAVKP